MIPFPEFAPDRSKFDPSVTDYVRNVYPTPSGYGPVAKLVGVATALPEAPRGAFHAIDSSGNSHIFAGGEETLYKFNATDLDFDDVSGSSAPYSVANDDRWSFALFGDDVIAVNRNDPPQTYTIGSSSVFADLGGSPPQASRVGVVGDHIWLGELLTQSREVIWSGVNTPDHWTVRRRSCDFQVFPDGGPIIAIIGSEHGGLVVQDRAIREIRRASAIPELVWEFQKTEDSRGAVAPLSVASSGRDIFYFSQNGFYRYGQPSSPIGRYRVDDFALNDIDEQYRTFVEASISPARKHVMWRYRSGGLVSSDTFLTDRVIVYDWSVDRWSLIDQQLTGLFAAGSPGFTLETLDSLGFTLDTLPFSLDSQVWTGGIPVLGGFTSDYKLGFFSGDNMEATLRTSAMEMTPGKRTFVRGFRPIVDATTVTGRVAATDRPGVTETWNSSATANATQGTGLVPSRVSGRLHRFEATVPEAATWTHILGVDPEGSPEGLR